MEYNLSELQKIANYIISEANHRTLLFYGEMGVGKTTLIKKIVQLLGSTDQVSSPTFSLVNEYHSPKGKIYHFDLYRIQHEEEIADIGFEDYFYDTEDWQLIEWPEKIPELIPEPHTAIKIERLNSEKRSIKIENNK